MLERILRGRDVAESLRRLERALAFASPELRARIARLLRLEIAALERGRVTAEEQRRIERLRRALRLVEGSRAREAETAFYAGRSTSPPPATQGDARPAAGAADRPSGVASTPAGSAAGEERAGDGSEGAGGALPGLPRLPDEITLGTLLLALLAVLAGFAALAFALAAAPSRALPYGRVRHVVKTSRSSFAFAGLLALGAGMLTILIGVLV